MLETFAPFIVGLTGSLHCLGMCGPLIMAWSLRYRTLSQAGSPGVGFSVSTPSHFRVSASRPPRVRFLPGPFFHHVAFHVGRLTTYGILGAFIAGFFRSFEVHRFSMQYRAGFATASGIILIGLGLIVFGALPTPRFAARLLSPLTSAFGRSLAGLIDSGSLRSKAGLGLLAGFLPCGLTWAMLVAAANTLSPARGLLTMISFGLGTAPALLAAGITASYLSVRTRLLGERAAALFIVIMGVSLAARGLGGIFGQGGCCSLF